MGVCSLQLGPAGEAACWDNEWPAVCVVVGAGVVHVCCSRSVCRGRQELQQLLPAACCRSLRLSVLRCVTGRRARYIVASWLYGRCCRCVCSRQVQHCFNTGCWSQWGGCSAAELATVLAASTVLAAMRPGA